MGGTRDKYVEATLHCAIFDLSVVFQEPSADLILVAATSTGLVPGQKRARKPTGQRPTEAVRLSGAAGVGVGNRIILGEASSRGRCLCSACPQ